MTWDAFFVVAAMALYVSILIIFARLIWLVIK